MTRSRILTYGYWTGWLVITWSVLQIHKLSLAETHSICGPWGCGPPTNALIANHGAWFMLMIPAGAAIQSWLPRFSRFIGFGLLVTGVLGLLGIDLHQAWTWVPAVDSMRQEYYLQRWGFVILTTVDVPLFPMALLGVYLALPFRFKRSRQKKADSVKSPSSRGKQSPTLIESHAKFI